MSPRCFRVKIIRKNLSQDKYLQLRSFEGRELERRVRGHFLLKLSRVAVKIVPLFWIYQMRFKVHVLHNSKKKGRRSSTSAVNRAAYRLCACLAFSYSEYVKSGP